MNKRLVALILITALLLLTACQPTPATTVGATSGTPEATSTVNPTAGNPTAAQTPDPTLPASTPKPQYEYIKPAADDDGTYRLNVDDTKLTGKLLTDFSNGKITTTTQYGAYSFEDGIIKVYTQGNFADSYDNYSGADLAEGNYADAAYIGIYVHNNQQNSVTLGLQGYRNDKKMLLLSENGSDIILQGDKGAAFIADVVFSVYRYCITIPAEFFGCVLIPVDRLSSNGTSNEPGVGSWTDDGRPAFTNLGFHVGGVGSESFDIINVFSGNQSLPKVTLTYTEGYFKIQNPEYSYTEEDRIMPMWKSNIMRNECITFQQKDGKISGTLLFVPKRIISVVDWSLTKEYQAGVDYEWVEGTSIFNWLQGSSIPYFYEGAMEGVKEEGSSEKIAPGKWDEQGRQLLDGHTYTISAFLYEKQVCVTYEYDTADYEKQGIVHTEYQGDKLQKTLSKLKNGEDINMLFYGASITSGCDASGMHGRRPYQPMFSQLVCDYMQTRTDGKVSVTNLAFGGSTCEQRLAALDGPVDFNGTMYDWSQKSSGYDLIVLAVGANNFGNGIPYVMELDKKIIAKLQERNPGAEIIIFMSQAYNPDMPGWEGNKAQLTKEYKSFSAERGFAYVEVFTATKAMQKYKAYTSLTGNGINHPNDWIIRFTAQNMLAAIFDFDSIYTD